MDERTSASRTHSRPRRHLVVVGALVLSWIATAVVLLPDGPDANIGGGALFLLTGLLTAVTGSWAAASTVRRARQERTTQVRGAPAIVLGVAATAVVVVQWTATHGAVIGQLALLGVAVGSAAAAVLLSSGTEGSRG